jgi:hypothetical protein
MDGPRVAAGTGLVFRSHLGADDYRAFLRKAQWRAVERMVGMLPGLGMGALGALAGCFVALAAGRADDPLWLIAAVFLGGLILYLLYRFALMPAYYGSLFSGQILALGDNKIVVDARGIAANLADLVIATPWSRVRMIETDRHVFLMCTRLAGIIVPERAFVSADEAKRFVAFVRAKAGRK